MHILFCSSEVFPFSKTGGLGDMASFLPKAIHQLGTTITVITPYYKGITHLHNDMKFLTSAHIKMGDVETTVHYFEYFHQNIRHIFIQNQYHFERDMLYGYVDDDQRFTLFSYAVLESIRALNLNIQIMHINDWQTGMIPYLLDEHYRNQDQRYQYIHTLLTIHNLEYQGVFPLESAKFFNTAFNYSYVHFNAINFLKAGIERATKINTVSPHYRKETLTQSYGHTLDGALHNRYHDYVGILNGIDDDVFDPRSDVLLFKNYNRHNVISGKQDNKKALIHYFGITESENLPVVAYVGRLATQKGIDLLTVVLEDLICYGDAIFLLMGSGQDNYQAFFQYLAHKYPHKVGYYQGFNETVAHQIYAASDLFMMPSRFEPCGLGQMIAMRYGSLPVVRETGGLKDTVIPYNQYTGEGTGFSFAHYDAYELKEKIYEGLDLYHHQKRAFLKLRRAAMLQDFSIAKMAKHYLDLYKTILGE